MASNSSAGTFLGNLKNNMSDDKAAVIMVIGVTVILFVFVIIYITFAMKSSNLKGKLINSKPIFVSSQMMKPERVISADLPKTLSGREYSYSLWMYIDEFVSDPNNNHAMIMYRGGDDKTDSIASANPIFFMDARSNKLYVVVSTQSSSITSASGNVSTKPTLNDILVRNWFSSNDPNMDESNSNKHLILPVDYVPLQRWVHVALVVDNKIVSLYLDGDLYSVKSIDEFKGIRAGGKTVNYNLVVNRSDGDVFIGKNPTTGMNNTIKGYVGKVEFFNYAINSEEVKKSYMSGPIGKNFLNWFGITQYGVRSPVYKIGENKSA